MKPIIQKQLLLLFMSVSSLFSLAQQRTVTGTVADANGTPIAHVSYVIKGTAKGGVTTEKGNFSIAVNDNNAFLEFTIVGYKTQMIKVGSATTLHVIMETTDNQLDEVIVTTALGVKKEKRSLGYSSVTISTEKLQNVNSPVNALTGLYGQASGLTITGTALGPAGGLNVKIRNALSLNESTEARPLFVIDGIPMLNSQTNIDRSTGNGLNDLNMDDIESFEILKGAKASVLYGASGGNGVILITTKSGKKRKGLGIDLNLSSAVDKLWMQQEFQNEFGSGRPANRSNPGVIDEEGFYLKNGVQAYYPSALNFGPRFDGRSILWYDSVMRPYISQPDNVKDLYRNGATSTLNASIQGGSSFGNFRMSYTGTDYKGIFENYKLRNHNFNFNGNINVTDRIQFKLVSTYATSYNHNSPNRNQNVLVTYGMPRNLDMDLLKTQIIDPATSYMWWQIENRSTRFEPSSQVRGDLAQNYFWNQWMNNYNNSRTHMVNSATLDIKLSDHFTWQTLGGFDRITNNGETEERWFRPESAGLSGAFRKSTSTDIYYNVQSILKYDGKITNDLELFAFVGSIYQYRTSEFFNRNTDGGLKQRDFFSFNSSLRTPLSGYGRGSDRLYAVLGSVQASYKNWLFVELQGRNDWSSTLPSKNNSYFYPGASASWIFTDALKLSGNWLNYGKFRVSAADLGIGAPRYFANSGYSTATYAGITTYAPEASLPPADLKPEKRRELEFGLEGRMFNSRVGVELNYYTRNTYNQIISLGLDPAAGYNGIKINAGEILNKGFEVLLNFIPVRTKHFEWTFNINGAKDRPTIKKLYTGITEQVLWGMQGARVIAAEGRPYGEIQIRPYIKDEKTGQKIVGANGLYSTNANKWEVAGNIVPDIYGGITNTLSYKGLALNFSINYQFGSTLISQTNMYMMGNGSGAKTLAGRDEATGGLPYYVDNTGKFILLPSHTASVPANAKYPFIMHDGIILDGVKADGTPNDIVTNAEAKYIYYWQSFLDIQPDVVYKNDYIKMRNITLSYTIPQNISSKLQLQRLQLSVFANNVFYFYKTLPNVDAESLNGTNVFYENNAFPTVRTFGASIRTTF